MKRYVVIIIVLSLLSISSIYAYKQHVIGSIKKRELLIKSIWYKLYSNSDYRLDLLKSKCQKLNSTKCSSDELTKTISYNKENRNKDSIENLWFLEYEVNEAFLDLLQCVLNIDSSSVVEGEDSLRTNTEVLNNLVENYNANVQDFNLYYSVFPNFIIARRNGFKRIEFFNFRYGEHNTENYKQKVRAKKWIETGSWD